MSVRVVLCMNEGEGQFVQKKNFLLLAVNVYGRKIYEKMPKLLCKNA